MSPDSGSPPPPPGGVVLHNATAWQRPTLRFDDLQYQAIFENEPRLLDAPADFDELITFIRGCNIAQQLEDFGAKPPQECRTTEIEPTGPRHRRGLSAGFFVDELMTYSFPQ